MEYCVVKYTGVSMAIKVNSFRHCLHILIFRSNSPADIETLLESVCTAHNSKGLEQEA